MTLAVLSSHPIQYHAPVYRCLQQQFGIPTTVIYGSDFSVAGYFDKEFGSTFAWDTDLLSGYTSVFLSRVRSGGAADYASVSAKGAYEALRAVNPEAVLLIGYGSRFDRGAFLAARRLGKPLMLRAETTDHAIRRSRWKRVIRDGALRAFYAQFTALLYIGMRSRDHYRRLGVPDCKLVFSPYCVDSRSVTADSRINRPSRESLRVELGLSPSTEVVLFSGKLVFRKGPDQLVDAYGQLPNDVRDATAIVFLGEGDMRVHLEEHARVYTNVRFVGFQNQSQLGLYYEQADLLAMPSRNSETWGLVVNEAMMHGLPCVVSDQVGCAPDLVEPGVTGEIHEAGSVDSLAAALIRGIALSQHRDTASRCRQKVGRYTVERAAEGIAEAYRRMVG